jgi:hypothetical protein
MFCNRMEIVSYMQLDIETKLGRLKIELQHTEETYVGAIAFEEVITAKFTWYFKIHYTNYIKEIKSLIA